MISINLSDKQARELLAATGWGNPLPHEVEREIFLQLEQKLMPVSNEQAAIAAWRCENGYTAETIEKWKRINEAARKEMD